MATVLIVSDSHGLTDELMEIKARHQTDYQIHCGDSELDIDADPLEGFYKVGGNCDFDRRYPNEQILEIDGLTFLVVHGHRHRVKFGLTDLSLRAREVGADIVCFGHTHVAGAVKEGGQLFINPGSILQPRSGRTEKTYAILDWKSRDEVSVIYYSVDGRRYDVLDYHTNLS